MQRSFFTFILYLGLCAAAASLCFAQKPDKQKLPPAPAKPCSPANECSGQSTTTKPSKYELNIMELTNSQMYRVGREMFLKGNNAEAAKVFLEIIRIDCHNKLAHYHLQKIAERDPAYAFLTKTLKKLPCGTYDFNTEDFLPASVYYEADTGILLEQLISYHKRQRLTEEEMQAQADKYNAMVSELEATITALLLDESNSTAASGPSREERLESARKIANKIDKQIAYLKSQVALERLERQKKVQDMRTHVAAAEANLAEMDEKIPVIDMPLAEPAAEALTNKNYSANAKALLNAVEQAKFELHNKELLLKQKDDALSGLQDRFDNILKRLKVIEDDLAFKNSQIKAIQTNLQGIQKQ